MSVAMQSVEKDLTDDLISFGSTYNISHEDVKKMPHQLFEIVSILNAAQTNLDNINEADLVIVLGNTGCGKSTMLNSLLLGPDFLEERDVKVQVNVNGKTKFKKQKRIEQKCEIMTMTIGHNATKSQTFFPHFIKKKSTNEVFADIAGLGDTNGEMVDTINCLINKMIFNRVKSLRFLVPFTHAQIASQRGRIKQQVEVLQTIFQ